MRSHAWRLCLAVGLTGVAGYFLAPSGGGQRGVYLGLGVLCAVGILAGIRIFRPARRLPWYLLVASQLASVVGDVIWLGETSGRTITPPFISWADPFYLTADLLIAVSLGLLLHAQAGERSRATLLDAGMAACVLGVVLYFLAVEPYLRKEDLSALESAVAVAYGLVAVLIVATTLRLAFAPGGRTQAFGLLGLGLLSLLGAYAVYSGAGAYEAGDPVDGGWLLLYVFRAAAALHPSMRSLSEPAPQAPAALTRWRLGLLGLTAILLPATVALAAALGSKPSVAVVAAASAALFLLALARMAGLVRDVEAKVEEVRAQGLRLTEAEAKYRTLVEQLPAVTYVGGLEPQKGAVRLAFISPQVEELLGYSPAEWIARPDLWSSLLHPEDRDRVLAELEASVRSGEPFHSRYRVLARGGGVRWVLDHTVCVQAGDGLPAFRQGVFLDVTREKEAEEERQALQERLREAQKLEAIGRIAGGIAHDFRNYLSAILGFSELLGRHLDGNARATAHLAHIERAARTGTELTSQLLAFARGRALELQQVEPSKLVVGMKPVLERLVGEGIELDVRLSPSAGPVTADRTQLEQVVMNLAVNARDAMAGSGSLTIETASMSLDAAEAGGRNLEPGRYVAIAVSDTGCGMDEVTRSRIFEPFFTTKARGEGTGLGLATSYGIVSQLGGAITVESEPGAGSTFTVFVPAGEALPVPDTLRRHDGQIAA